MSSSQIVRDDSDFGIVLSDDERSCASKEESGEGTEPSHNVDEAIGHEKENTADPDAVSRDEGVSSMSGKLRLSPAFHGLENPVPVQCRNHPCCVGIDEAGRGPVIGSMIFGAAYWPICESKEIEKLGFNDSKQLSNTERERMLAIIESEAHSRIGSLLCELSAEHISTKMLLREPVSLNEISFNATISLIQALIKKDVNVAEIYVDAVGNSDTYQKRIQSRFPHAAVVVKPKADAIYKVVGAASICAKVFRDQSLKKYAFRENYESDGKFLAGARKFEKLDCSGYPGDPKTKQWLTSNSDPVFGYPSVVRHSWKTIGNLYGQMDSELTDTEQLSKKRERVKEQIEGTRTMFYDVDWGISQDTPGNENVPGMKNYLQAMKRESYYRKRLMHHQTTTL